MPSTLPTASEKQPIFEQPVRAKFWSRSKTVTLVSLILLTGFIVSPHFERGNAPSFTRQRRLEFGPNHVEWVPEDAIEVLQFDKGVVDLVSIPALQGMSEHAIAVLSGRQSRTFGPGYIDITESGLVGSVSGVAPVPSYPTPDPSAHPEVDDLIAKVSAEELKSIVGNMTTNEPTRYFRSTAARSKF